MKKKEIKETFFTPKIKVDGNAYGFTGIVLMPYLPKGLESLDYTVVQDRGEFILIEIETTKEKIEKLKKDKKIKWLKR